jgi:hypothetical protein
MDFLEVIRAMACGFRPAFQAVTLDLCAFSANGFFQQLIWRSRDIDDPWHIRVDGAVLGNSLEADLGRQSWPTARYHDVAVLAGVPLRPRFRAACRPFILDANPTNLVARSEAAAALIVEVCEPYLLGSAKLLPLQW